MLEILNVENVQAYQQARLLIPADEIESQLFKILTQENISIGELTARTGLAIEQVSAMLIMMELKGMIRQSDGSRYMLIKEPFGEYRIDSKA
jgi:predicted Rossmann fold nucleotide-binding protein DprA/Smf involved in DNA uptake